MSTAITELFGTNVFSVSVMRERLPKKVFAEVTNVMENGGSISMSTADVVANAMKNWALEKGLPTILIGSSPLPASLRRSTTPSSPPRWRARPCSSCRASS